MDPGDLNLRGVAARTCFAVASGFLGSCGLESEEAAVVRLVDLADAAEVRGADFAGFRQGALARDVGEVIHREEFESELASGWFERNWKRHGQPDTTRPPLRTTGLIEHDGQVHLFFNRQSGGVQRFINSSPDCSYRVTARVRSLSDGEVRLDVVPIGRPAPETLTWIEVDARPRLKPPETWPRSPKKPRSGDRHGVSEDPFGAWQVLTVDVPAHVERQSLKLALSCEQDGGALVDWIEVRRQPAWTRWMTAPNEEGLDGAALRRRIRFDSLIADGFLLPGTVELGFAVRLPRQSPRFHATLGSLMSDDEFRPSRVEVFFNDQLLTRVEDTASLQSIRLSLEEFSGQSGWLRIVQDGDSEALLGLAAPTILSSGVKQKNPSVLLISLDGVRGDAWRKAPWSTAVRFPRVISGSPDSLPAHVTLLTGTWAARHQVLHPVDRMGSGPPISLAEAFRDQGWVTAAFTGSGWLHPEFGFDRGFETYHFVGSAPPEPPFHGNSSPQTPTVTMITEWLRDHGDQPFFLFLQSSRLGQLPPKLDTQDDLGSGLRKLSQVELTRRGAEDLDSDSLTELRRRYDARLEWVTHEWLRPILAAVRDSERQPSPVVSIVSCQGTEFGEHGFVGNGRSLWKESIRVPWILEPGPLDPARPTPAIVGLADVAPTLCALAGVEFPASMAGRDVFADISPSPGIPLMMDHWASGERDRWDGLVSGSWKLLRQFSEIGVAETYLYHQEWDPREIHDLSDRHPEIVNDLQRRLQDRFLTDAN